MGVSVINANNSYVFAYQPIVRALNQEVIAYELLLREFNNMSNMLFLQKPELYCQNLDELVRSKAKTMKHLMLNEGVDTLFMHFTPDQIAHVDFNKSLGHFYDQGIPPSSIAIEVTEQSYAKNVSGFYKNLKQARKNGHPIVVDDFGSGGSNFGYVQDLRPSIVKTDKSLLDKALTDEYCLSFLRNLINFLRYIGCRVVVEGVETERHLEIANLCQAHYLQGYYFGRPVIIGDSEHRGVDQAKALPDSLELHTVLK
jgi:EAL domain-containing protein (putative c-di-GMP-specific phosphodiesterase class I)